MHGLGMGGGWRLGRWGGAYIELQRDGIPQVCCEAGGAVRHRHQSRV